MLRALFMAHGGIYNFHLILIGLSDLVSKWMFDCYGGELQMAIFVMCRHVFYKVYYLPGVSEKQIGSKNCVLMASIRTIYIFRKSIRALQWGHVCIY